MGRENSSHWRALWPEMTMKGFNQDEDEKSCDTETQRGLIVPAYGLRGTRFSRMRIRIM